MRLEEYYCSKLFCEETNLKAVFVDTLHSGTGEILLSIPNVLEKFRRSIRTL